MKTKNASSGPGIVSRSLTPVQPPLYLVLSDQRLSPLGQTRIHTVKVLIVHLDNNRRALCATNITAFIEMLVITVNADRNVTVWIV